MKIIEFLKNLWYRRLAREALADDEMRARGIREGRVFIEDWRRIRASGANVPEGGLLPKRPNPSSAPPMK